MTIYQYYRSTIFFGTLACSSFFNEHHSKNREKYKNMTGNYGISLSNSGHFGDKALYNYAVGKNSYEEVEKFFIREYNTTSEAFNDLWQGYCSISPEKKGAEKLIELATALKNNPNFSATILFRTNPCAFEHGKNEVESLLMSKGLLPENLHLENLSVKCPEEVITTHCSGKFFSFTSALVRSILTNRNITDDSVICYSHFLRKKESWTESGNILSHKELEMIPGLFHDQTDCLLGQSSNQVEV